MNNIALSIALATAPSTAFEELRARPKFWFPLLLVVLSTAGMMYWYYAIVDIEWLKDAMYGANPDIQKLPEEERAGAMAMVTRGTLLWTSVIGVMIFTPAMFALIALYLLLAAKVTRLAPGYKHWFALTCWTSLPLMVSVVVSAIFLLIADTTQLSPSILQPLSLNELLLHRPVGDPGFAIHESLNIPSVLGWVLMIIGVRTWSQRSWAFSTAFILLPVVVIYALWAFFAFR